MYTVEDLVYKNVGNILHIYFLDFTNVPLMALLPIHLNLTMVPGDLTMGCSDLTMAPCDLIMAPYIGS